MYGNDTYEKDVPIDLIRHSERRCYVQEGHGGREIERWPIYRFFLEYLDGSSRQAEVDFAGWYREQFLKYRGVPKRLGGMQGGSLARTLDGLVDNTQFECGPGTERGAGGAMDENGKLQEAITARVKQRFELLEAIRTNGYEPDQSDPVLGIEKAGSVYLEGGHHRVAALKALGWSAVPKALVFRGPLQFRLWRWQRAVLHALVARGRVARLTWR